MAAHVPIARETETGQFSQPSLLEISRQAEAQCQKSRWMSD